MHCFYNYDVYDIRFNNEFNNISSNDAIKYSERNRFLNLKLIKLLVVFLICSFAVL